MKKSLVQCGVNGERTSLNQVIILSPVFSDLCCGVELVRLKLCKATRSGEDAGHPGVAPHTKETDPLTRCSHSPRASLTNEGSGHERQTKVAALRSGDTAEPQYRLRGCGARLIDG